MSKTHSNGIEKSMNSKLESTQDDTVQRRTKSEKVDSALLSPLALMALGLTGAASVAVSREMGGNDEALNPVSASDNLIPPPSDLMAVDQIATEGVGEVASQMNELIQNLLVEKTVSPEAVDIASAASQELTSAGKNAVEVALHSDSVTVDVAQLSGSSANATAETPLLLAQAPSNATTAVSAEAAGTAGAGVGVAAAAEISAGAFAGLLGLGVVAIASSSSSSSKPVDTTAPVAPTLSLATDSGVANDAITNVGTVNVTGLEAGATWQYSLDAGSTWTAGTGTSVTLTGDGAKSIEVRQTDAAGNVSDVSTALSFTLDTAAAEIQSMAVHSGTKTIDLTFNAPLDPANLPAVGAFLVTTGGVSNPVASLAVSGNVLTLTLTNAFTAGTVNLAYVDPTSGDDALAIQDLAGNDALSVIQGKVADGYVRGAQIYIDSNANGIADAPEKLDGVVTDANGNFFLPDTAPEGPIIAVGGVNIDTGVPNTVPLKAPAGATTVNPLTTLVQAVIEAAPTGTTVTVQAASDSVAQALGLTLPQGVSLANYDPLSAADSGALLAQKAAAQIATILTLAASAPATGTTATQAVTTVTNTLVTQVKTAVTNTTTVNLSDPNTVDTLFLGAVDTTGTGAQAVTDAKTAVVSISTAADLSAISVAQSTALDNTAPAKPGIDLVAGSDSGSSSTDNITNDATPTLRISLEVVKTDGTSVVAGDTVTINSGGSPVASATVLTSDLANGYIDVTLSQQVDATLSLTSVVTDKALNASPASTNLSVTIDAAISTPAVALTTNSGLSSDTLSNVGTVTVTGEESGALVQYSTDGGTTWNSSFSAIEGANSVQVRQTDVAGNTSQASSALAFTLDSTAAAAPKASLATNSGAAGEGITNVGTINVTGLEDGATWQYSLDAGSTWTAGTGTSVTLNGDGEKSVTLRQTDVAGNTSQASSALAFTLDNTAPAAAPVSPLDGGLTLGLAADLVLGADETLVKGDGTVSIFNADDSLLESIDISSAQISIIGAGAETQISINPSADLSKDAQYYVKVSAGAFTDVAGNAWAGISDATTWNFTGAGATVLVTAVTGDNVVNLAESGQTITITGTLGAEAGVLAAYTVADMTAVLNPASGSGVTLTNLSYNYTSGATGSWSADVPASTLSGEANYTLNITFTGSTGAANGIVGIGTQALRVDTVVAAPQVALTADTGIGNSDAITNNGTIDVTGTESGSTTEYSIDGGSTWSSSFAAVSGINTVLVRQTDAAGNTSGPSNSLIFTLDTTAPATATIDSIDINSGSSVDRLTSDNTPTLTVTAEAGATLKVGQNGVETTKAYTVNESTQNPGTYTISFSEALADGTYGVSVTDLAGNKSASLTGSQPYKFTIDATAPAQPQITVVDTNTGNTTDRITSDNTPTLTVTAEAGLNLNVGLENGSPLDASAFTVTESSAGTYTISFNQALTDGAYGIVAVDAAGNVSTIPTSLTESSTFLIDTVVPAEPLITGINVDSGTIGDRLTNDNTPTLTVTAETGALKLTVGQSGTQITQAYTVEESTPGTYTISISEALADGTYGLSVFDQAGNKSLLSSGDQPRKFTIDTTAPVLSLDAGEVVDGAVTFTFNFSESVLDFTAEDIDVTGGTAGAFTNKSATEYTLVVTPESSTTPIEFSVSVAAGAAHDAAGNLSTADAFSGSILFGTAGDDTLTVGPNLDYVYLGAGKDVIALNDAANSTLAKPDEVLDFGADDSIDLSGMLAGSGYTGSALGDSGAGFVELKNVTLTQNTNNTTTVKFDVHFDAASIGGSGVNGAVLDLIYNYSAVSLAQAVSPKFADPVFGNDINVWSNVVGNLSGASANGKIALTADLTAGNPIIDANGKALSVTLIVSGLVNSFDVGLEAVANGGTTAITTADNVTHNVDVGVTKTAGLTVGADGILEIITDTDALGTVGDNQLHMVTTYDADSNMTHLQVQYDTNSTFGTTAESTVIAMDFDGDVTANLTPAHLNFI